MSFYYIATQLLHAGVFVLEPLIQHNASTCEWKGYKKVQYKDTQAAHQPGQMFDDEGLFWAPQGREDQYDA